MNEKMKRVFVVDTPLGQLRVSARHDIDSGEYYPGVFVELVRKSGGTYDLAVVEYDSVSRSLQTCIYEPETDEPVNIIRHKVPQLRQAGTKFWLPVSYSVRIGGTGGTYVSSESLGKIRDVVASRLSFLERKAGILDYLCTFRASEVDLSGRVEKSWRNFTTDCIFEPVEDFESFALRRLDRITDAGRKLLAAVQAQSETSASLCAADLAEQVALGEAFSTGHPIVKGLLEAAKSMAQPAEHSADETTMVWWLAEEAESLFVKHGKELCIPSWDDDEVPCFLTDQCENTRCPCVSQGTCQI